jgi:hypothetical protein
MTTDALNTITTTTQAVAALLAAVVAGSAAPADAERELHITNLYATAPDPLPGTNGGKRWSEAARRRRSGGRKHQIPVWVC